MTDTNPAPQTQAPPNRPAKVALIAALLSWLPGVGVVAIVAGLLAGNQARVNGGVGRGRAVTGVVVGIVSLMLWAMLAGALIEGRARLKAVPAVNATKEFIRLVGSGNVTAAKGLCTDAIDTDRLTDTAEEFTNLGGFNGDITPYAGRPLGDGVQVDYRLPFTTSVRIFSTDWTFIDGHPRLVDYRMRPEAGDTTRPAK